MNKNSLITRLSPLAAVCIFTVAAQAQLIVYEGFEYGTTGTGLWTTNLPNAGKTILGGGFGFAASSVWLVPTNDPTDISGGTANFNLVEPGHSWGTLPVKGNRLLRNPAGGTEHLAREVSANLAAAPEMWFGVLLTDSDNTHFVIGGGPFANRTSLNLVSGSGPGFGLLNRNLSGTGQGGIAAAVWNNAGTVTYNTNGDFAGVRGTTYFIVGRVQFNVVGGDDVLTLYNVGTNLTLGTPIATRTNAAATESNLKFIAFNSNRGPGLDEIRIATSFAGLLSEPPLPPESTVQIDPVSLTVPLYAPATTATGTVAVSFAYGSASNNVELLSLTFTNPALSCLTALPITLTNPATAQELSIKFDNSVAGLTTNFATSTGNPILSWKEVGGSVTNTATFSLLAVYRNLGTMVDATYTTNANPPSANILTSYDVDLAPGPSAAPGSSSPVLTKFPNPGAQQSRVQAQTFTLTGGGPHTINSITFCKGPNAVNWTNRSHLVLAVLADTDNNTVGETPVSPIYRYDVTGLSPSTTTNTYFTFNMGTTGITNLTNGTYQVEIWWEEIDPGHTGFNMRRDSTDNYAGGWRLEKAPWAGDFPLGEVLYPPQPAGDFTFYVVGTTATVAPPELSYSIDPSGSPITFTWNDAGGPFKLVAQTNALSVGITTNWWDYPNGTNGVQVPVVPANPTVFFRLQKQ